MKIKKRKKSSRMHGKGMGTHGWGARKKHKKSGHRGGKGMAGTGKRADQKKTLVTKLYKGKYFGKQGITSKGTKKDKRDRINLQTIEQNIKTYVKKRIAKKISGGFEIELKNYKILGSSKEYMVKNKLIIKSKEASQTAINKIEKLGGQVFLSHKFAKKQQQTRSVKEKGGEINFAQKSANK